MGMKMPGGTDGTCFCLSLPRPVPPIVRALLLMDSGELKPALSQIVKGSGVCVSNAPSLLEELGLDESTLSWHQLSSCKNMDLSLFYELYEDDVEIAKAVDERCLTCPVFRDCLMDATDNKDYGVRAAIYLVNGKPDKQRNAHKTEEVWARIQARLS
jgi:hypothetical protein